MKKIKSAYLKIVFELCKLSLKANPIYYCLNFIVWLIISIIPIFVGLIIQTLFSNISLQHYMTSLFLLDVILIANVLITYIGGICDSNSRFYLGNYLRKNLLNYLLNNDDKIDNAIKINLLNIDIDIIEEFISFTMDFINKLIYFILAFIVLSRINLSITILLLSFIVLSMFIIYNFGEKIKKLYIDSRNKDFKNIEIVNKTISNYLLIKFMDFDYQVVKKVHQTYQERNKINIEKIFL